MEWIIDKGRPICPQICEQLCLRIANGMFAPHEKILSVREIAVAAGVNPNTVQRSLEELERRGILYSVRGSGWFVADDIGGGVWDGSVYMCTRDDAFTIFGVEDCLARGHERTGFFEIDTEDRTDWTVQLTPDTLSPIIDPSANGARP